MDKNGTALDTQSALWENYSALIWGFVILILFSVVGDIFTLFVIRRTKALRSAAGDLFTSQVSSCIPRQIIAATLLVTYVTFENSETLATIRYVLRLLLTSFRGITTHTLTAICLNIYCAMCHSIAYRNRMSKKYIKVFIPICWILNITLGMSVLALKDPVFVANGILHRPSTDGSALLAWCMIFILIYILPALITAFAFTKMWIYCKKIQSERTINRLNHDKYLLTKAIVALATCYISLWSLMLLLKILEALYEPEGSGRVTFKRLSWVPYALNLLYDAFKIGMYVYLIKPIRTTVLKLVQRKRAVTVAVIRVSVV